ncbi:MAG: nicotinate-nucleotide diphosphorylase (carboxylating), partial [Dehalococcoidia bacterium]|nr:nicotinate-nucleotide diphosphorylase (carboxylating) [Dehalococcoidia bacterium]
MTAPTIAAAFTPARLRPELPPGADDIIRRALAEDIGRGDLTTRLTVPPDRRASAALVQKAAGVLAGAPVFEAAFALHAPEAVQIAWLAAEGSDAAEPRSVALLRGPAAALLTAERVALNFVQRLSGVATLARRLTEAVAHTRTVILDTRKTVPGLRVLDKRAVVLGGGSNHRIGLYDMALIKNNHITAAGGITA